MAVIGAGPLDRCANWGARRRVADARGAAAVLSPVKGREINRAW